MVMSADEVESMSVWGGGGRGRSSVGHLRLTLALVPPLVGEAGGEGNFGRLAIRLAVDVELLDVVLKQAWKIATLIKS